MTLLPHRFDFSTLAAKVGDLLHYKRTVARYRVEAQIFNTAVRKLHAIGVTCIVKQGTQTLGIYAHLELEWAAKFSLRMKHGPPSDDDDPT